MIVESTIKTHVERVLLKLGVRDCVQEVMFACESGLIAPGSRTQRGQTERAARRPPSRGDAYVAARCASGGIRPIARWG